MYRNKDHAAVSWRSKLRYINAMLDIISVSRSMLVVEDE